MTRRPALLAALLASAIACGALGPSAAIGSGVGNAVTMFSDSGDYIGGGNARIYDSANASIGATSDGTVVDVSVSGGTFGDSFDLEFAAPPGEKLRPGLYENAQRAPFREAGRPGIDISGDGRGCNEDSGRFDVKQIRFKGGALKRLWLTYEQHCEGAVPALFGEVRMGLAPGTGGIVVAPRAIWWPDTDPGTGGQTVPVTVLNTGPADMTMKPASTTGLNAGGFAVRVDNCAGTTLGPGDSCDVWVRFLSSVAGPAVARLKLPRSDGLKEYVALDGFGVPGRTRWKMQSDAGDYIGHGLSYDYVPSNAAISVSGSRSFVGFALDGANGDWWYADFDPGQGDILAPGTYPNATRYPFNGTGVGLSIYGNGRGCNTLTGQFTVTDAHFNTDQSVRDFGVKFEQHCEGATPALYGTILYRVPKGDVTPPAKVTNLQLVRDGNLATASWTNPPDADYAATIVRMLPGTIAPAKANSGLQLYAGTGTSASIPDPSFAELSLAVFTADTSGNVSHAATITAP